jgi:hypothetical protein
MEPSGNGRTLECLDIVDRNIFLRQTWTIPIPSFFEMLLDAAHEAQRNKLAMGFEDHHMLRFALG